MKCIKREMDLFRQRRYLFRFFFNYELEALIGAEHRDRISQADLVALPEFLRFNRVQLWYCHCEGEGVQTIAKTRQLFGTHLQTLKMALNGSKLIVFKGTINHNDPSCFNNHLHLVDCIRNQMLRICDSSIGYMFAIRFESDLSVANILISTILQIPEIVRCKTVQFDFFWPANSPIQLPIDPIWNWLIRTPNQWNIKDKRYLNIELYRSWAENDQEVCDYFEKVYLDILNWNENKEYL